MKKIFIALDHMTDKEACSFIEQFPKCTHYKVGLELYLRYGHSFVQHLIETYQLVIFLDLKLHDIPETVGRAILSLSKLKIHFLTLHVSGGEAMVKRAIEVKEDVLPHTKLLGVTYLTSMGENEPGEIFGCQTPPIKFLAKKAVAWGLDGIIASAPDLSDLRDIKTLKVCPGIRFAGDDPKDQKRIATPSEAFSRGANYLVIGRSLTQSEKVHERMAQLSLLLPGS